MDVIEIREIIKAKNKFDDYTIQILTEYLDGVQRALSDYITIDEAINRLVESEILENGIQIVDSSKIKTASDGCDASFSYKDHCIYLDKNVIKNTDELYKKYIIFHELTHAMSIQKKNNKTYIGLQDNDKSIYNNLGMNEAITEYLTSKILEKQDNYKPLSGYECVVEQLINVFNIVDEKDIMDCYFCNAENFDEIISNSVIDDPHFFEFAFNILMEKEKSLVQIRRREFPEDEFDTVLLAIKDNLYMWYTQKYLPVDNINKFEEKIKFLSQFVNQHDSLNYVDEYATYIDVLCDIEDLKEAGYKEQDLFEILEKNNLNREKFEEFIPFNFTDSQDIDDDKRTEKAIELYELYKKMGREKFCDVCDGFFMRLYNDFFIEKPNNTNDLYNYFKLPVVGRFLKQNSEYDFDELSITKVDYRRIVNKHQLWDDYFYIIKTSEGKNHIVFEEFDDGTIFNSIRVTNNKFIASYKNVNIEITLNGDEISFADLNSSSTEFLYQYSYRKKSNLEYLKEKSDTSNDDKKVRYNKIVNDINERINNRRDKNEIMI